MNIVFNCSHCQQELEIDDTCAGEIIECPSCTKTVVVPGAVGSPVPVEDPEIPAPSPAPFAAPAIAAAPAAPVEADFIFKPKSTASNEIQKPFTRSLEVMAKGDKKIMLKTVRREDCRKDGNDRFDEIVSEFLQQLPDGDLVSISPIHYSYPGKEPGHIFEDYGVVIVFKQ